MLVSEDWREGIQLWGGVPLTKGEVGSALAGAVQIEKDGFWTKLEGNC